MGFINDLKNFVFNLTTVSKKPSKSSNSAPPYLYDGLYGHEYYPPVSKDALLSAYQSWVYVFASKNATSIANVPLNVYVSKNSKNAINYSSKIIHKKHLSHLKTPTISRLVNKARQVEEIYEHPLITLLEKPNPVYTGFELKYLTVLHLELTGDSFWYIVRDAFNRPKEIWPLNPAKIKIIPSKKNFIAGYIYVVDAYKIPFEVDEIIHFKYPHPNDPYWGISPLEANWNSYNLDISIENFQAAIFKNMGRPDGIIMFDHNLDDESFERIRINWQKTYGGSSKAGKIAILEGGSKYQQISTTPRDLEYIQGKKVIKEQLANAYGQTLAMYSESANRSNADTAIYTYMLHTIMPKINFIVEKLNASLVKDYDNNLFIGYENIVPEDKEYQLKKKDLFLKNGIKTINETRQEEGLEPVIYGEFPMVNMAARPYAYDTTNPDMIMDDAYISEDKDANNIPDKKDDEDKDSDKNEDKKKSFKSVKKALNLDDVGEEFWIKFIDSIKSDEDTLKNKINDILKLYVNDILKVIKNEEDYLDKFPKEEEYADVISIQLAKYMAKVYNNAYKQGLNDIKKAIENKSIDEDTLSEMFNLKDENAIKALQDKIDKTSIKAVTTIKNKALQIILEGITNGWTNEEIIEQIELKVPSYTLNEAEIIARTEIIWAGNMGRLEAFKNSQMIETKIWYTALDERTCEYCASLHGKEVKLEDSFDLKQVASMGLDISYHNGELLAPPLHPHCFDEATKVLTDKGFKYFRDLKGNEKFISINPKTLDIEYVKAVNYISYDYMGDLIKFKAEELDLLVTPDHQMVYNKKENALNNNMTLDFMNAKDYDDSKGRMLLKIPYNGKKKWIDKFEKEYVFYNGKVYDVELEKNHILYVNRNGKSVWSGNCRCIILPGEIKV